jgi:hypothetical protein
MLFFPVQGPQLQGRQRPLSGGKMISIPSNPQVAPVYQPASPASTLVVLWHQQRENRPELVVILKSVQPRLLYCTATYFDLRSNPNQG